MISRIMKDEVCEVDNTNRGLDNSRYHAKTESNHCFIMYSKPKNKEQYKWNTRKIHSYNIFFNVLSMFLKQLNDSNQSFKQMKINIPSKTCRSVLFCSFCVEQL